MRYNGLRRYFFAVTVAGLTVFLRWVLIPVFGFRSPYLFVYPSMVVVFYAWGVWPGVLASLIGIIGGEVLVAQAGPGALQHDQ